MELIAISEQFSQTLWEIAVRRFYFWVKRKQNASIYVQLHSTVRELGLQLNRYRLKSPKQFN